MDEQLFPRQRLVLSVTWWPGVEKIARCQHFNCCVITFAMMPRNGFCTWLRAPVSVCGAVTMAAGDVGISERHTAVCMSARLRIEINVVP